MVSLTCCDRLDKYFDSSESQSETKTINQVIKENCVNCAKDFCGDCGSFNNKQNCPKNKYRKTKQSQPITASSTRKMPTRGGLLNTLLTDNKFLAVRNPKQENEEKSQIVPSNRENYINDHRVKNSRFIVKLRELKEFFRLTEDRIIQDFFKADRCKRIADKYLIAMVFAYFKRANFALKDYTRLNFFICLYLANDMEEDEEEIKYEIFPWVLGKKWRDKFVVFLRMKDNFFRKIQYKAIVSRRCCDEIMAIEPDNPLWKRERPLVHGGAVRNYMKGPEDENFPRGPNASPRLCADCDAPDSQYESHSSSPGSTCWYISSDSSPNDRSSQSSIAETRTSCNVREMKRSLPKEDDEIWPMSEE